MGPGLRAATLLWLKIGDEVEDKAQKGTLFAEPLVFPYVIQLMSGFNVIPLCMYEGL